MPERACEGCTRQSEWGCTAKRWRTPEHDEPDGPENWINPAHLPLTLMGEEIWACPRQPLREEPLKWAWMLKFYGMYRKGHLPNVGAIADQSNKAIEIFRILDHLNDACDREELDKPRRDPMPNRGRRR
ncbi:hypothetical protein [Sinorhizobium fredii]|uniref:hypothetical protein n=1 Tax=Rhizobium fredii TaxID=380 RepID=UPI001296A531|nr:hypothetical protein [Sinorhizobium fredii]MQW94053.1 hypothetical protein [Sinorhizobium fredii]